MNDYRHLLKRIDATLAEARRVWPDLPAWRRDPITGEPRDDEMRNDRPLYLDGNPLVFDDRFQRDAAGRSAAEPAAIDIDDGKPIPSFLRRGPAAASPASSAPPVNEKTRQLGLAVEQGIFDILYEDYDLRPSTNAPPRPADERAERRGILRRALDAITGRLGGSGESAARPRDVRWGDDADYVPTPRFSNQAQGPNQTGNRWRQVGDNIWTLETEAGEYPMAEQPTRDFSRADLHGKHPDPVQLDPIGDAELDAFAAKVRSYVDENRILNEHIKNIEEQLKVAQSRVAELEEKHTQIHELIKGIPCGTPTPATPA